MKNFIFKSQQDFHKILFNKLVVLLDEQKHQRCDLDVITRMLKKLLVDKNLQNTVDKYFERDETSPQTDLDEQ